MQGLEQNNGADAERVSKFDDVEQGNIALAALDSADVIAMEVCQLGESLLRQAALSAQPTQPPPELDSRIVSGRHASSLAAAHYESTHDECDMIGVQRCSLPPIPGVA